MALALRYFAVKKRLNFFDLTPMARFVGFAVSGVDPKIMGIGPVLSIPKVLTQCGLKQRDIGHIELNEAFAAQSLAVIQELNLDPEIINPLGGCNCTRASTRGNR